MCTKISKLRGGVLVAFPSSFFKKPLQALADGVETEEGGIDLREGNPLAVGHIVEGLQGLFVIFDRAEEELVECVHKEIGIEVGVGQGEKVVGMGDGKSRLLQYLAADTLFACLVHVDESAGKVKGAFGWFFGTAAHKQFVATVHYQSHGGRTGVEVVGETALDTTLRLLVVLLEMG